MFLIPSSSPALPTVTTKKTTTTRRTTASTSPMISSSGDALNQLVQNILTNGANAGKPLSS